MMHVDVRERLLHFQKCSRGWALLRVCAFACVSDLLWAYVRLPACSYLAALLWGITPGINLNNFTLIHVHFVSFDVYFKSDIVIPAYCHWEASKRTFSTQLLHTLLAVRFSSDEPLDGCGEPNLVLGNQTFDGGAVHRKCDAVLWLQVGYYLSP